MKWLQKLPWNRPTVIEVDVEPLPEDVAARAAEIKAQRPPYRLVYGVDLKPGMTVLVDRPCNNPFEALIGSHDHGVEQRTILDIREAPQQHLSCITMGEDGDQQPFLVSEVQPVPVVVDPGEVTTPEGVPAKST